MGLIYIMTTSVPLPLTLCHDIHVGTACDAVNVVPKSPRTYKNLDILSTTLPTVL